MQVCSKTYTQKCPAEIYTIVQIDCIFVLFPVSNQSSNTNLNDVLPKEYHARNIAKRTNLNYYHYVMKYKTDFFL